LSRGAYVGNPEAQRVADSDVIVRCDFEMAVLVIEVDGAQARAWLWRGVVSRLKRIIPGAHNPGRR
jgi:hypothetical protein